MHTNVNNLCVCVCVCINYCCCLTVSVAGIAVDVSVVATVVAIDAFDSLVRLTFLLPVDGRTIVCRARVFNHAIKLVQQGSI